MSATQNPFPFQPQKNAIPVAKEGLPFIAAFLVVGLGLALVPHFFFRLLGGLSLGLAFFSVFFFRDPERRPVQDAMAILAPGDGCVLEVAEEVHPDLGASKVVRIFLSVFDVHVQRSPIAGKVTKVEYRKGKFLDARNPRACFENEQNKIVLENEQCRVAVHQISGFIARRIICWVLPAQTIQLGQRIGLIRFGSQVDLYLPKQAEICVAKGDRVISGVSLVALQRSAAAKPV